jgi:hypothetical protein
VILLEDHQIKEDLVEEHLEVTLLCLQVLLLKLLQVEAVAEVLKEVPMQELQVYLEELEEVLAQDDT